MRVEARGEVAGSEVGFLVSVALGGASFYSERSPSRARAGRARRFKTARAWPRAAQHQAKSSSHEMHKSNQL